MDEKAMTINADFSFVIAGPPEHLETRLRLEKGDIKYIIIKSLFACGAVCEVCVQCVARICT